MEQRPKPHMGLTHVAEDKLERTRVVTMSGVLPDALDPTKPGLRVWCEEHWKLPTDNALDKQLLHEVWWTTDRNKPSRSFDAALAGALPESEPQMEEIGAGAGAGAGRSPKEAPAPVPNAAPAPAPAPEH